MDVSVGLYRSLAKKGPWALYLTLSADKGVGGYLWHCCINYDKAPTYVYITRPSTDIALQLTA